jgi:hypothetical protein
MFIAVGKDLVSLALTSRVLNSDEDPAEINNMLQAAGFVAQSMPKLQTMEIWNGRIGHACIFRYHAMHGFATVTCDSVWDLQLESHVIQAWKAVALEYSRGELFVEMNQVPNGLWSHGEVIDRLELKQQILHPNSLHQLRIEERNYFSFRD